MGEAMKQQYINRTFRSATLDLINTCNGIISEYQDQGFDLTVRQIHYQLVSRDVYANTQANYNKLGRVISNGRLAGLVDWNAVVDRTRNVKANPHWTNPASMIEAAARSFYMDRWKRQRHYVEVWIEKDALVGVIQRVCNRLDVPYFSCRGYTSQSSLWRAARRIITKERQGKACHVVHLSDHDPSGIDMARDLKERLELFGAGCEVRRVALTMKQVDQHQPPPNFAKERDPRFKDYELAYGDESWELDALNPTVITELIESTVGMWIDQDQWDIVEQQEAEHITVLDAINDNFIDVRNWLEGEGLL